MTDSGEVPGTGSGAQPHPSQASLPRKFQHVHRGQDHFRFSTAVHRI